MCLSRHEHPWSVAHDVRTMATSTMSPAPSTVAKARVAVSSSSAGPSADGSGINSQSLGLGKESLNDEQNETVTMRATADGLFAKVGEMASATTAPAEPMTSTTMATVGSEPSSFCKRTAEVPLIALDDGGDVPFEMSIVEVVVFNSTIPASSQFRVEEVDALLSSSVSVIRAVAVPVFARRGALRVL